MFERYTSKHDSSIVYEARLIHALELNEYVYEIRLPGTEETIALVPSNSFESIYERRDDV